MDGQPGEENYEALSIDDRLTHKVIHLSPTSQHASRTLGASTAAISARFDGDWRLLFFVSTTLNWTLNERRAVGENCDDATNIPAAI